MQNYRPSTLNDIIGQERVKNLLRTYLTAAQARSEALEHTLLLGPRGLGKTTLARAIANEMGSTTHEAIGEQFESVDLSSTFSSIQPKDILFIDEVHAVRKSVQETLFPIMEDGVLHISHRGRPIKIKLPEFTLIGATTDDGGIAPPMRDRFGIIFKLEYYSNEELATIVSIDCEKLHTVADELALLELASRSRGTPRVAKAYLRRVRDFAQVAGSDIDLLLVQETLTQLGIDSLGLDEVDRIILKTIAEKGYASLGTIVAAVGMDKSTVLLGHEPYLIQAGLITRSSRGRVLTDLGIEVTKNDSS